MRHRRTSKRSTAIVGAGIAALLAVTLNVSYAHASERAPFTPDRLSPTAASALATELTADPENGTAGAYYDAEAEKLVVNVVDRSAASDVETRGAEARLVEHTAEELDDARQTISQSVVPGTAVALDPVANKLVVTVDRTVQGAELAELSDVVAQQGDKAVLERSTGEFRLFLAGGDAVYTPKTRCSVGFNVTVGGEPAFLTAGHCDTAGSIWSTTPGGAQIGVMQASTFPGGDYGLVKYTTDLPHPSEVNLYNGSSQQITRAGEATVGMQITRSGSTNRLRSGTVTAVDVTVAYPQGTVHGLIESDACGGGGDSGGPAFSGSTAIGLISGGIGDCVSGGESYFQPVTEVLAAYGARLG